MARPTNVPAEVRERTARLVREHGAEHLSQWAALKPIAATLGSTSETPRRWRQQRRVQVEAARCTLECLMKSLGLRGAGRGVDDHHACGGG